MHTNFLELLKNKRDEKYREFTSRLLPKDVDMLGVRIPEIRKILKDIIKNNKHNDILKLNVSSYIYQEELILHALVLAHAPINIADKIELIKKFVPYINSWAVCDIFCADLKQTKNNLDLFYEIFQNYTNSNSEYQIRFFYVLALNYFINEEMINNILNLISKQKYVGYYDKMAVAWFLSMAYVKFPQKIQKFIFETPLEKFILSKTISKICDSYQVKKEAKSQLRNLASQIKN